MKRWLLGILVGIFCLGLIQVAGAEEWKKVELDKGVAVEIMIPQQLEPKVVEREKNGEYQSAFLNEGQDFGVAVLKGEKSFLSKRAKEWTIQWKGKYPFDLLTKEEEKEVIFQLTTENEEANFNFVTLSNGHRILTGKSIGESIKMKAIIVRIDQYFVGVVVGKNGIFTDEEQKIADEIFKQIKF